MNLRSLKQIKKISAWKLKKKGQRGGSLDYRTFIKQVKTNSVARRVPALNRELSRPLTASFYNSPDE